MKTEDDWGQGQQTAVTVWDYTQPIACFGMDFEFRVVFIYLFYSLMYIFYFIF